VIQLGIGWIPPRGIQLENSWSSMFPAKRPRSAPSWLFDR
jgi:hypothetical protein